MRCITAIVAAMVILLVLGTPLAKAQQTRAPASAPATSQPGDKPLLKPEQLEQLLAAIALYPDPLITQILMASTYPLEVVQADRWAKAHKDLKGDALAKELEALPYDPSVKSLINFPEVLAMMSEKLDLTQQIGDAFIAQQADVMNTIQKLRAMANAEGQLKSNEQQKVTVVQAPPTAPDTTIIVQQPPPTQVITIQPTQPEVIYVPSYNPTVVYGAWPYPYYPPAPYYPPGYVASNVMSFGVGVACGAAWGYAWGNSNWGRGDVDIDINRNTNFNRNIDRSKHQQNISNRQNNRGSGSGGRNSWQHDPGHRGGVPYSDRKTANQYGRGDARASQAREQYRGRADAGRQDLARGGADGARGSGANAGRGNAGQNSGRGTASQTPARGGSSAANRPSQTGGSAANRGSASSGNRGGAFNGAGSSGSSARASSQRGQASRSSGGSRSGGGGSRGGGGGSRGGGGGGGRGRSDVNLKTDFASVDAQTILEKVLALPITSWTYNDDPTSRHLGPMAQDFYRSFGIGTDDKTITFLDEGGVALSAIQGLNQKLEEKDARIQLLEKEVAELKALVQALAKTAGVNADAEQQTQGK